MKPSRYRSRAILGLILFTTLGSSLPAVAVETSLFTSVCDGVTLSEVTGPEPESAKTLATFPNDHAACRALWVPLLDAGTIPQGLALVGDGTALVSGHVNSSRSTARIVRISLTTGAVVASRDIPRGGHAGGIEIDDAGGVWIASTNKLLYWPSISATFSAAGEKVRISTTAEDDPFKASFITSGIPGRLWIGSHQTSELLEFPTTLLTSAAGTTRRITRVDASSVIDIPSEPEGAAWRAILFVSSSRSTCGVIRAGTGPRLGFGPGAQQIEFDAEGRLWSVFQAGSARYPTAPYFPVIASFDFSLFTEAPDGCGSFGI